MIRRIGSAVAALGLAGALGGCEAAPAEGRLSASWTGADTGKVAARPTVVWCRDTRRLEVSLVQEDLGIGLVLYPADTLGAGEFPAFDPGADTVIRPSAAAAVRRFTEQSIEGYQSDSGQIMLEESEGRFAGRFGFRLHSLDDAKTLRLTGTLAGLAPAPCPTDRAESLPPDEPTE